jgi:hypothetical protein
MTIAPAASSTNSSSGAAAGTIPRATRIQAAS